MLAYPQVDLFTAQYCTKPITYFPSSSVMLAYPQGDLFTAKYGRDVHSYNVGTETKKNKKERKKHRVARQKRSSIPQEAEGGQ